MLGILLKRIWLRTKKNFENLDLPLHYTIKYQMWFSIERKNWLYFIKSVTSVEPMEPKRIKEIEKMTTGVNARKIYVIAFLYFKTFKNFLRYLLVKRKFGWLICRII